MRSLKRASGVAAVAAVTLLGLRTSRTHNPVQTAQQLRHQGAYEVGDRPSLRRQYWTTFLISSMSLPLPKKIASSNVISNEDSS